MFWKNITVDYAFIIDNSVTGIDNNHLITIGLPSDWIKDKVFNLETNDQNITKNFNKKFFVINKFFFNHCNF